MEMFVWLIVFAILIVIEACTMALTTIWFAGGALAAFFAALLGLSIRFQLILLFGIRVHPVGEYHPTWGDRTDGRRLRTLPPMAQVSPYIMVTRNTSSNLFEDSLEITHIDRYIRRKRKHLCQRSRGCHCQCLFC